MEATERQTVEKFCEELSIEIEAESAPFNPNMSGPDDNMDHWACTLKRGDEQMRLHFSKGRGLREPPPLGRWNPVQANYGPPPYPFGSVAYAEYEASKKPVPPTAAEVLSCLALDASGWENASGDFGDWCSEYGYDDPGEAWKTFQVVSSQRALLKRFLPSEAYERLLWETEPE